MESKPDVYLMTEDEVLSRIKDLGIDVEGNKVWGVPRGGVELAKYLKNALVVTSIEQANVVLDDIVDTGATRTFVEEEMAVAKLCRPFYCLVDKQGRDKHMPWVVFPWERGKGIEIGKRQGTFQGLGIQITGGCFPIGKSRAGAPVEVNPRLYNYGMICDMIMKLRVEMVRLDKLKSPVDPGDYGEYLLSVFDSVGEDIKSVKELMSTPDGDLHEKMDLAAHQLGKAWLGLIFLAESFGLDIERAIVHRLAMPG